MIEVYCSLNISNSLFYTISIRRVYSWSDLLCYISWLPWETMFEFDIDHIEQKYSFKKIMEIKE